MKVYIAAPFFNEEQINTVKDIEGTLNRNGIEYFSPRSEGTLKKMDKDKCMLKMGEIFESNISHMDWCTHAVAVIDGYDKGVLFEMGYLYATNKKIVSYTNEYAGINVMLNEAIASHCKTLLELLRALRGTFEGTKTGDVT